MWNSSLRNRFKKQLIEETTFSFHTSSFQLQAQNSMSQSNSLLPPRKVYIKLIMVTILCYINDPKNNATHQRSDQNTYIKTLYAYNLLTELFMSQTSPRLSLESPTYVHHFEFSATSWLAKTPLLLLLEQDLLPAKSSR